MDERIVTEWREIAREVKEKLCKLAIAMDLEERVEISAVVTRIEGMVDDLIEEI